jgi:hypothetical protein
MAPGGLFYFYKITFTIKKLTKHNGRENRLVTTVHLTKSPVLMVIIALSTSLSSMQGCFYSNKMLANT